MDGPSDEQPRPPEEPHPPAAGRLDSVPGPENFLFQPSALPSTGARVLAFGAILVAGLCGGLIGYSFTDLQCTDGCGAVSGVGAVVGAAMAAGGVAVIAVLVLRAMSEWRAGDPLDE